MHAPYPRTPSDPSPSSRAKRDRRTVQRSALRRIQGTPTPVSDTRLEGIPGVP